MKRPHHKALLAIAMFKWFKGALLILLAVGFLELLHQDVGGLLEDLANKLRVDPDNRYLAALLAKLNLLDDRKLEELSGLTFVYSTLFLIEGTGLYYEKRWAEFLTVITTAAFIPLELYELSQALSVLKFCALAINAGIVIFLIVTLRRRAVPGAEELGKKGSQR